MPMSKRAATALEKSIKHWERMADLHPRKAAEKPSAEECSLCQLYCTREQIIADRECLSCPVMKFTGRSWCNGTPYDHAVDAFFIAKHGNRGDKKWRSAAAEQITFLKSLRDPS